LTAENQFDPETPAIECFYMLSDYLPKINEQQAFNCIGMATVVADSILV